MTLPIVGSAVVDEGGNTMLSFTQRMRMRLLNAQTSDGEKMPTDVDSVNLVTGLLNDMDKQALTLMRMQQDKKIADESIIAEVILARITNATGADNPFRATNPAFVAQGEVVVDLTRLPTAETPAEKMEIGVKGQTYDDFIETYVPPAED